MPTHPASGWNSGCTSAIRRANSSSRIEITAQLQSTAPTCPSRNSSLVLSRHVPATERRVPWTSCSTSRSRSGQLGADVADDVAQVPLDCSVRMPRDIERPGTDGDLRNTQRLRLIFGERVRVESLRLDLDVTVCM